MWVFVFFFAIEQEKFQSPILMFKYQVIFSTRWLTIPFQNITIKEISVLSTVWLLVFCDEQPNGIMSCRLEDPRLYCGISYIE